MKAIIVIVFALALSVSLLPSYAAPAPVLLTRATLTPRPEVTPAPTYAPAPTDPPAYPAPAAAPKEKPHKPAVSSSIKRDSCANETGIVRIICALIHGA